MHVLPGSDQSLRAGSYNPIRLAQWCPASYTMRSHCSSKVDALPTILLRVSSGLGYRMLRQGGLIRC